VLYATTSALCYSLAAEHAGPQPDLAALAAPYNDVTAFVQAQRARLDAALRLPLLAATLAFALAGLRRGGRFHRLSPALRARQVAAWRRSPLGPCRDLIRFYESLAVLALFARPELAPPAPAPAQAA
jgi:hypothetical protein